MTKVDLKDAYFMVPIHREDRAFLKLSFREKTYQFTCQPFGLACTQWVFTKILKPLAAQLRQLEMRMIVNIDNFLILAGSRKLAREHVIGLIAISSREPRFCDNQNVSSLGDTVPPQFVHICHCCGVVHSE